MSLEIISCANCNVEFEDGDLIVEYKNKHYHYAIKEVIPPIMKSSPCNPINNSNVNVFYKGKVYDFDEVFQNLTSNTLNLKDKTTSKGVYGHKIAEDLSFLDNIITD